MSSSAPYPSFSDPDTVLHFPAFDVNTQTKRANLHSLHQAEPTGLVSCGRCAESAWDVDEIPHHPDCPQFWVRSRDWWERHPDVREEYRAELLQWTGDPTFSHGRALPARTISCDHCGAVEWADRELTHNRFCPEHF